MYYQLTYRSSIDKKQVGDFYLCGEKPMDIGQTNSCDIRLPESMAFESVVFATILPKQDKMGWLIIKRTDFHEVFVNGNQLRVCQPLEDGDLISFRIDEQVTSFEVSLHDDGEYSAATGVVYKKNKSSRKAQYLIAGVALMALLIAAFSVFMRKDENILRHANLDRFDASVYHIRVDSVYLIQDSLVNGEHVEHVLEAVALEQSMSGTCFLTEDSLFVTARHCVEPWITDEDWKGISYDDKISPAVRLATIAETRNKELGEERYSVKAHCIISKKMEQYEFYSSDFQYNKTRDQVVCLGTDKQPIYWRTIMPLASKRDMELGDFAYVKSGGLKGNLKLADMEDMKHFDEQHDKDIVVIGFPVNDNHEDDICVKVFGNSQHIDFKGKKQKIAGCIQMTAPINPGNSGGPILARIGGEPKVIGIVSKADGQASQGTFWAVPVTEVRYLQQHGGMIMDSLMFRR